MDLIHTQLKDTFRTLIKNFLDPEDTFTFQSMTMGKKTSSREKIFENQKTGNPVIDLNKFAKPLGLTGIKSMGVILGAGPEGLTRKVIVCLSAE
jgi:hypothetical protein